MGWGYNIYGERHIESFVWKPELKNPLGRPGHRLDDINKMHFQKEGSGAWTGLSWQTLVNEVTNIRIP